MQTAAPRRGRPPNAVTEIKRVEPVTEIKHAPAPDAVRVTLLRNYVPRDSKQDETGGFKKRLAGEEISVPVKEAMFLCSHGIARMDPQNVDN